VAIFAVRITLIKSNSNVTRCFKNRWLVCENSYSPAVGSPRRPIKKSLTLTEKFNANGYSEKKTGVFEKKQSQKKSTRTKHLRHQPVT